MRPIVLENRGPSTTPELRAFNPLRLLAHLVRTSIRLARKLSEDKLPSTPMEHHGRV